MKLLSSTLAATTQAQYQSETETATPVEYVSELRSVLKARGWTGLDSGSEKSVLVKPGVPGVVLCYGVVDADDRKALPVFRRWLDFCASSQVPARVRKHLPVYGESLEISYPVATMNNKEIPIFMVRCERLTRLRKDLSDFKWILSWANDEVQSSHQLPEFRTVDQVIEWMTEGLPPHLEFPSNLVPHSFWELWLLLYSKIPRTKFDLHSENVMIRPSTGDLVVIEAWYGGNR